MKLRDFVSVAVYNDYWVSVYLPETGLLKEFKSTDKLRLKAYEYYIVTEIWILDENNMCVSVMKGDD